MVGRPLWHRRHHIGGGHPQHRRLFDAAQGLHLALHILRIQLHQTLTHLVLDRIPLWRLIETAWVEQLIQQLWITTKVMGNPGAGVTQVHQLRQRHGIFHQQGDIGTASADTFKHVQQARQGLIRMLRRTHRTDQQGDQMVHSGSPLSTHPEVGSPLAQGLDQAIDLAGILISRLLQRRQGLLLIQ